MNERQAALHFKAQLRQRMRTLRRALPEEARATRSEKICARLSASQLFASAQTVAAYLAFDGEANLNDLFEAASLRGKRIALPFIEQQNAPLGFQLWDKDASLVAGTHGIMTLPSDAQRIAYSDIDLALVPCTAVDTQGNRLGMGQGYYDRTVPLLNNATLIAIAYDFQRVPEVPRQEHDIPMHAILSEDKLWTAQNSHDRLDGPEGDPHRA